MESTPLVIDGVMYVTGAWSKLFALDAETGKEIRRFDPKVPGEVGVKACCDVARRRATVLHFLSQSAKTWKGEWWKFGGGGTVVLP